MYFMMSSATRESCIRLLGESCPHMCLGASVAIQGDWMAYCRLLDDRRYWAAEVGEVGEVGGVGEVGEVGGG